MKFAELNLKSINKGYKATQGCCIIVIIIFGILALCVLWTLL